MPPTSLGSFGPPGHVCGLHAPRLEPGRAQRRGEDRGAGVSEGVPYPCRGWRAPPPRQSGSGPCTPTMAVWHSARGQPVGDGSPMSFIGGPPWAGSMHGIRSRALGAGQEHLKRCGVGELWDTEACVGGHPKAPPCLAGPGGPQPGWGSTSCSSLGSDLGQGGVGVGMLLLDRGPEAISTWGGEGAEAGGGGGSWPPCVGGLWGRGHTGYSLGGSRQALW